MDLSGHINDLIMVANEMKNQPGANKKALNKTVARLEEAKLWAKEAVSGRINGVPGRGTVGKVVGMNEATTCTCPPGVVDNVNCLFHAKANVKVDTDLASRYP